MDGEGVSSYNPLVPFLLPLFITSGGVKIPGGYTMRPIHFILVPVLAIFACLPLACSNNNPAPTTPAPVTVVATRPPSTVAGKDWTFATLNGAYSARYGQTALTFNNAMWIIGGVSGTGTFYNDVWTSTDGKTWTQVLANNASPGPNQFSQREFAGGAVFNNKMWIIGGYGSPALNDVWSSSDGLTWTQVLADNASPGPNQFPRDFIHSLLVYNNKLYVIAGVVGGVATNAVWSSPDGITWTNILANNASPGPNQFSQREYCGAVVFNNAMWIMTGYNGSNSFNDTWTSTDGITWTNKLTNAASPPYYQFSQRSEPSVLAFDNVMWVIGGSSGAGPSLNDVWYSANGVNWSQITASASFPVRSAQSGLVYNNAMWILAGLGVTYFNDVWYSPF